MSTYTSTYTGAEIDEAIGNARREATSSQNGLMSAEDKVKLEGFSIQSDWSTTNESDDSFVKNKPYITYGTGAGSIIEGNITSVEDSSTSTTYINTASGDYSYAGGFGTTATGDGAHAEGAGTKALGDSAHAEGYMTQAQTGSSHAEGNQTIASGLTAHAEGYKSEAEGENSHAEGSLTVASGSASHSEGAETEASGLRSHAEGYQTKATGDQSHAEGVETVAEGVRSHAEGYKSEASGDSSHAEGNWTVALGKYQHVQGKYNEEDEGNTYADIVGGGTGTSNRKNIETTDWSGNKWVAGSIRQGGSSWNDATPLISEAPTDGKRYVRSDGGWVEAVAKIDLFIDLWNATVGAEGTYNTTSGYFELNGLTDITYEQAVAIYANSNNINGYTQGMGRGSTGRTNIPTGQTGGYNTLVLDTLYIYSSAEKFRISSYDINTAVHVNLFRSFIGCSNLIEVAGYLTLYGTDFYLAGSQSFQNCPLLETIYLKGLSGNYYGLSESSALSNDSILYMIENNSATSAITITLHADAYARAMDDNDILAELDTQTFITLASA